MIDDITKDWRYDKPQARDPELAAFAFHWWLEREWDWEDQEFDEVRSDEVRSDECEDDCDYEDDDDINWYRK